MGHGHLSQRGRIILHWGAPSAAEIVGSRERFGEGKMQTIVASAEKTVNVRLEAVETRWEINPDQAVSGYGYNGQVPGPTIEANVGDTLIVELTNRLPEPTSIHWHGLRIPAAMDGTALVQKPVKPGETFQYRFVLPDAGTFWYHPHANETVQLERGLYGVIVVRGPDEPHLDGERVLVLDDVKLDRKGDIARFGGFKERHDGRLGATRLVNGEAEPEFEIAAGQVERWRILNASSSRYVLLSLGARPFTILGSDGGLIPQPVTATQVLLAPADRVELAVGPFDEGETLALESLRYDRGMPKDNGGRYATVRVGSPADSRAKIPRTLRTIEPLVTGDVTPTRTVNLQFGMSLRRGFDWMIEGQAHRQADPVRVGEPQVWDLVNETRMDHPFHLHGFFFQVVAVNGTPPEFLSWEDTVNVPADGHVRIAWMPDDRPGSWMYHCHILEHHAAGMMAHFELVR
jgi:FtsP/CotA-like multicopper oxidase with cupredoxin domain